MYVCMYVHTHARARMCVDIYSMKKYAMKISHNQCFCTVITNYAHYFAGFKVFTVMTIKTTVSKGVTLCGSSEVH
jgi:hypothetical protein